MRRRIRDKCHFASLGENLINPSHSGLPGAQPFGLMLSSGKPLKIGVLH